MAKPTRPSDRLRDLVLLARTDLPGQPDVGLPRRSSMPSRTVSARLGDGNTREDAPSRARATVLSVPFGMMRA